MVLLPRLDVVQLKPDHLHCDSECDGLLISFSFKLLILLLGSWALFFRWELELGWRRRIRDGKIKYEEQRMGQIYPVPLFVFAYKNFIVVVFVTLICVFLCLQAAQGHHAADIHFPSSGDNAYLCLHLLLLALLCRPYPGDQRPGKCLVWKLPLLEDGPKSLASESL